MPRDSFVHLDLHTEDNVENYEPDSYYEPDGEDFAWMIAQEKDVTRLRSDYHEAAKELRNYQVHTDRQLRGLDKQKRRSKRRLARAHHFDVISDSFEVEIAHDVYDTVDYCHSIGSEDDYKGPEPLTRKDKRMKKTKQRKAERKLRIRRTQWEKSRAASLVRKTRALVPTVAA